MTLQIFLRDPAEGWRRVGEKQVSGAGLRGQRNGHLARAATNFQDGSAWGQAVLLEKPQQDGALFPVETSWLVRDSAALVVLILIMLEGPRLG